VRVGLDVDVAAGFVVVELGFAVVVAGSAD